MYQHMMPASFMPQQQQGGINPFLEEQFRKEKGFQQGQQKTPWMQQPGMFGVDRQNALMGGLGLLTGGRMF
jgi:hypothetical protein